MGLLSIKKKKKKRGAGTLFPQNRALETMGRGVGDLDPNGFPKLADLHLGFETEVRGPKNRRAPVLVFASDQHLGPVAFPDLRSNAFTFGFLPGAIQKRRCQLTELPASF